MPSFFKHGLLFFFLVGMSFSVLAQQPSSSQATTITKRIMQADGSILIKEVPATWVDVPAVTTTTRKVIQSDGTIRYEEVPVQTRPVRKIIQSDGTIRYEEVQGQYEQVPVQQEFKGPIYRMVVEPAEYQNVTTTRKVREATFTGWQEVGGDCIKPKND